ncbi:hypothetical protein BGZ73_006102 [Actinomortierella ambigua]|nr:hypothetical protein BGZ73_006102 [Actinomortierella ambigua]
MLYSNPTALGNDLLKLVGSPTGADIKFIIGNKMKISEDLKYIYSGQVTLNEKVVPELIQAADELRIKDLVYGCEEFALKNLSNENVFAMTMLASLHGLDRLRVECHDHIAFNFDVLKKGRHILTLDSDNLLEVLAMDQLDVPEIEIWKVVVRWAYFQQGLDWEHCPLLNFPKPPGCVVVTTMPDSDADDHYDAPEVENSSGGGNDGVADASPDTSDIQAAARAVSSVRPESKVQYKLVSFFRWSSNDGQ